MKFINLYKYIAGAFFLGAAMLLPSCSDFTDLKPKGKNLLSDVSELRLLLDRDCRFISVTSQREVCGDLIYAFGPIETELNVPVKTQASIIMGWDEEGHKENLPSLTSADGMYTTCYEYIGRIANPILSMIDVATGSEADKKALKAEALAVRAFFHFLAVQKFAPAYDKATASDTWANTYLKEDHDITMPTSPTKLDVYYQNILDDIEAALELNALPEVPANKMHLSKGAVLALKAHTLICMQEPAKAAEAAKEALSVNNEVANYNDMLVDTSDWAGGTFKSIFRPRLACVEDYFSDADYDFYNVLYTCDQLEPGHTILEYFQTYNKAAEPYAAYYPDYADYSKIMCNIPGKLVTSDTDSFWPSIALSTPQMYLILAENAIGNNQIDEAMRNLDIIRKGRICTAEYAPLEGNIADKASAMKHLKQTALGEGITNIWGFIWKKRWTRLDDYKETYRRNLAGKDRVLTPDSRLWTFPIPQNVVSINPNFKPYLND